eukprot:TRINITY_DN4802_c0_g2_i8.p1 TRINITY_DN4802_c0_g2~~TRINITY_DN4802_c0_g2_i8.p1  ORF type:complete len:404 (+),score=73.20 TRINITY_DN4802_c0_g2_i8:66-1277(+)
MMISIISSLLNVLIIQTPNHSKHNANNSHQRNAIIAILSFSILLRPLVDVAENIRIKADEQDTPETRAEVLPTLSIFFKNLPLEQSARDQNILLQEMISTTISQALQNDALFVLGSSLDQQFCKRNHLAFPPCKDKEEFQALTSAQLTGWSEKSRKHLMPKTVIHKTLSGFALASILQTFVETNNRSIPVSLSKVVEKALSSDYSNKLSEAMKIYEGNVMKILRDGTTAFEDQHIVKVHHDAEVMALDWYASQILNHGSLESETFRMLQTHIAQSFHKMMDANRRCSESHCHDVFLKAMNDSVAPKISQGSYEFVSSIRDDWVSMLSVYASRARGPAKFDVLDFYLRTKILDTLSNVHENILSKEYHLRKINEDLVRKTKHFYQMILVAILAAAIQYLWRLNK